MPAQRIRFRPSDAEEIRALAKDNDSASDLLRNALRKYNARPEVETPPKERATVMLATFVPDNEMRDAVQKASREGRALSDILIEIIREDH